MRYPTSIRLWLALIITVVLGGVALTMYFLPELVRRAAIARIGAMAERSASIDRVDLNLFTGRATVHGFRLAERDGHTPFADFKRLDLRLHLPSLLVGHVRMRELILTDSTVRVVRLPTGEFNFSDLIRRSGATGRAFDVTVDHLGLTGGTVTLEDRALPEQRTWTSEQIEIQARNVSTRGDDGRAVGRSVTGGAPVSVDVTNLRLYPVRLQATVRVEGLDLTLARVYLPPDAPIVLDGGRATMSVTVALDAREGLRGDATARFEDVAVIQRDEGEQVARIPSMETQVSGLGLREGELRLARLAAEGTMSIRDPGAKPGAPFRVARVRADVADLTWPAATPGRLDVLSSVPGGGMLAITGTIQPPPAPSQLRLRLANLDLAPWAQFLPVAARVIGMAEADLQMNEPLAAGIPARVHGSIAVNRLRVIQAGREVLGAGRIEGGRLELQWPRRVFLGRVLVTDPRGVVERDRAGAFPLKDSLAGPAPDARPRGADHSAGAPPVAVDIGEIVVRNGAMAWRDQTVSPPVALEVSSFDGRVTGIGWPLRGPAGVRLALSPPGGGRLHVSGRVGLDPLSAELLVGAKNVELRPYQPYLPTPARLSGAADFDVALAVPSLYEGRVTARGSVAVSRVDVRDREQTVLRIERAQATGVHAEWPERIVIGRLVLAQPWILIQRDDKGTLPLRALLSSSPPAPGAAGSTPPKSSGNGQAAPAITISQLGVDGGGVRLVDRAVAPAFAVDFQPVTLRMDGFSTAYQTSARLDLHGRLGPGAELTLHGTLGSLSGPLRLELNGELREFAVPRANPYVLQHAGWKTTEGRLTSTVQARVDGEALSARTDIRISRLQLVRAAPEDGAQARIGLPLNMLTALMKDRGGDIRMSFPVGGRLNDPQFDFREVIWNAVRTVSIRAITLPVSWIGRVHFTPDSRIERIEVDPVPFEPGTSTLTAEGQTQALRLAAFLDELPEVKLAATPVVSAQDITEIKHRMLEATVERVAREERLSREAAARRLFNRAFPHRPAPDSLDTIISALLWRQPAPAAEISELAARRLATLKNSVERAGIDPARLAGMELVLRDGGGRLELNVVERKTERPSKLRETLRRLGVPVTED